MTNRLGNLDTKAIGAAWSRFETASIAAVNSVFRRVKVVAPRAFRAAGSTKAYLIGVPLTIAIPVGGVVLGLMLARNPRFTQSSPLVDAAVGAGFFLVSAFFTAVKSFGLLGAVAIAAFVVLVIFLLCARLVGASVLALFRREANPPDADPDASDHAEVDDLELATRATSTTSSAGTIR